MVSWAKLLLRSICFSPSWPPEGCRWGEGRVATSWAQLKPFDTRICHTHVTQGIMIQTHLQVPRGEAAEWGDFVEKLPPRSNGAPGKGPRASAALKQQILRAPPWWGKSQGQTLVLLKSIITDDRGLSSVVLARQASRSPSSSSNQPQRVETVLQMRQLKPRQKK